MFHNNPLPSVCSDVWDWSVVPCDVVAEGRRGGEQRSGEEPFIEVIGYSPLPEPSVSAKFDTRSHSTCVDLVPASAAKRRADREATRREVAVVAKMSEEERRARFVSVWHLRRGPFDAESRQAQLAASQQEASGEQTRAVEHDWGNHPHYDAVRRLFGRASCGPSGSVFVAFSLKEKWYIR